MLSPGCVWVVPLYSQGKVILHSGGLNMCCYLCQLRGDVGFLKKIAFIRQIWAKWSESHVSNDDTSDVQ